MNLLCISHCVLVAVVNWQHNQLVQDQDEERSHQFLMGLGKAKFGNIWSNLINMEPFPKLSQVYQRFVRDERQQNVTRHKEKKTGGCRFLGSGGKYSTT